MEEAKNVSWYKRTSVWGIIISMTALVLSQLPPVASWIRRVEVTAQLGSRIGLPTQMGIPGCQLYLDVKNKGNRYASISDFSLELECPNGSKKELLLETYSRLNSGQQTPVPIPLTSISLSAGQSWAEQVLFNPKLSPQDDEEVNKFVMLIQQSIMSKYKPGSMNEGLVEADPKIVSNAVGFFDKKFDLEKGSYRGVISCFINGERRELKRFAFTLYDFHIVTLKSHKDEFKYGAGVYYQRLSGKDVWAFIQMSK